MDRKQPNANPEGQPRDNVAQVIDEMPVGVVFYDADGEVIRGNHLWQSFVARISSLQRPGSGARHAFRGPWKN